MATNEQTQKDTAKAESRTFGRSKQTQKDTAKAESRTFGRSKRAKEEEEEEEEELLVQEEILRNNPMMQPTDLIGQQGQQETVMDTNPLLMGGLGLGGGFVASQTGGAPATSQVLDFAGEIQNNPTPYSSLVDNSPFTALGGTPVEENPYTVAQAGLTPEERARIETRLARTNADILAENTPEEYRPIGGGFSFGGDIPIPADREGGFIPTPEELFARGTSEFANQGKAPAPTLDTALAEQGTTPALAEQGTPQSLAEQGSPQAFFEEYRSKGPLTPEQIARGEAEAARMGTTFDPETGFSRDPFLQFQQAQQERVAPSQALSGVAPMGVEETRARLGGRTLNEYLNAPDGTPGVSGLRTDPQGRMIPAGFETRADAYPSYEDFAAEREGRLAARMQQPGESITERDTRIAAERTQSSQNVPTDVREAMLTPEGRRTAKQINRLARWGGSTQGQEMGGVAGLEQSLQPVDAQKQQYDAMRAYKLGLEIDKMQQEKPSEYQESAAEVDEAIAAGSIKPEDRNKFILRDLGWQAKGGEDSSDLMSIIYGDGAESGGKSNIPQAAIDALISDPSKASEFDKYFGPGSSAKFL